MANTIALKRRITSVKNTKQITKAMELVAASKMRRAQEQALRTRDYSSLARQILTRLRELTNVNKHPLFKQRPITKKVYIVITSDRGLAGAYNSNVLRQLTNSLKDDAQQKVTPQLIVVGKQVANFVTRLENIEILAAYTDFTEKPSANDIAPILQTVTDLYKKKQIDAVDAILTNYKSSISQIVEVERLLPAAFSDVPVTADLDNALFEPSPKAVLDTITQKLIEAELSQIFYESQASEQSMRMMAMKNATDNANELVDDLTLAFNTARQAAITQELAEITGGAEAIK
jgi:F-type H+-transporting ATPase subunit gamma